MVWSHLGWATPTRHGGVPLRQAITAILRSHLVLPSYIILLLKFKFKFCFNLNLEFQDFTFLTSKIVLFIYLLNTYFQSLTSMYLYILILHFFMIPILSFRHNYSGQGGYTQSFYFLFFVFFFK